MHLLSLLARTTHCRRLPLNAERAVIDFADSNDFLDYADRVADKESRGLISI